MTRRQINSLFLSLIFVLCAGLGISFSLQPKTSENLYDMARAEVYNQQLAEINSQYPDQLSSRLIVKANKTLSDSSAVASATGYAGLNIFQYESREEAERARGRFEKMDGVRSVEFDSRVELEKSEVGTASLKEGHLSWGAEYLKVDEYQKLLLKKFGGIENLPKVYVAVLDTGVDTDHEFLQGRIAYEYGRSYYSSTQPSKYSFEDDGTHGTHVAGTIVDLTPANVMIIPIKILNSSGGGTTSNITSAIEYCIGKKQNGVNIVALNLSLGGYGEADRAFKNAIDNAYNNDIMTVVAAGNSGYFVETEFPANIESALTVGAVGQNYKYNKFLEIGYYSNYGEFVDVTLPGSGILSCVPSYISSDYSLSDTGGKYMSLSGTSMATPHASAICALYATYYGDKLSVRAIEDKMKTNTIDLGDVGRDDIFGYGMPCMTLARDEYNLNAPPLLNVGKVGTTNYLKQSSLLVTINNQNDFYPDYTYKIYYTLDGSYPTVENGRLYDDGIQLDESALIRFIIYLFNSEDEIVADSTLYETTFYLNGQRLNDSGIGFTISSNGTLTKYTSGLRDIKIPEKINGKKVTGLGDNLFEGLDIESVECDFDLKIGNYPFSLCSSLKKISLASEEGNYIASYCFNLTELSLPQIAQIQPGRDRSTYDGGYFGSYTFYNCFNLRTVSIPKVTIIPNFAFSGYLMLESLQTGQLTSIGQYAFENCLSLTSGNFERVTTLSEGAFYQSGLTSYFGYATSIGENCFAYCPSLQYIELPMIVTVGTKSFYGSGVSYVMFGKSLKTLKTNALSNNQAVTIYCYDTGIVPGNNGHNRVFLDATLQEASSSVISATLTGYKLQLELYMEGALLDSQNYDGVNYKKSYSFSSLFNGSHAYELKITDFYGTTKTLNITKSSSKDSPYFITINSNIASCGVTSDKLCYYQGETVRLTSREIDGYNLLSVKKDGEEIEFIDGEYSFAMSDKNVVIEVTYESEYYELTYEIVGRGQVRFTDESGNDVVQSEAGKEITISYSGEGEFNIKEIYYYSTGGEKIPVRLGESSTTFVMPAQNVHLYVVFGTIDLTGNFDIWYHEANQTCALGNYHGSSVNITLPQYVYKQGKRYQVTMLYADCFRGNANIESVTMLVSDIEEQYISIEGQAFENCTSLTDVNLGRIKSVGLRAFSGCTELKNINLEYVESIGAYAFQGCTSLKSVNLSKCTTLGSDAFENDTSLVEVVGLGATDIPNYCFNGCEKLEFIDLSHVTAIGNLAFWNCNSLLQVDFSSVESLGKNNATYATKIILGENESLITQSEEGNLSHFARNIYISQNYQGEIGEFIQNNFTYVNETEQYIVRSKNSPFEVVFKIDNDVIYKDFCDSQTVVYAPKLVYRNGLACKVKTWTVEGDPTNQVLSSEEIKFVTQDTTYVAKEYEMEKVYYQVIYYYGFDFDGSGITGDEGDIFQRLRVEQGAILSRFNQPSRQPTQEKTYTFLGWKLDGQFVENQIVVNSDLTLVGTWQEQVRQYKVSWINGDGSVIYSEMLDYGSMPYYDLSHGTPQKDSKEPYNYSYKFMEWSNLSMVTADTEYYARFEAEYVIYTINYYYGYDYDHSGRANDEGDIVATKQYRFGGYIDKINDPPSYTEEGVRYDFDGWNEDVGLQLTLDNLHLFSQQVLNLYAQYQSTRIEYTISWLNEGKVLYQEIYYYGDNPNYKEYYKNSYIGLPTKEPTNYLVFEFNGWTPALKEVTEDAAYNASYIERTRYYRVTWQDADGLTIYSERLSYDQPIAYDSARPLPTMEGNSYFYYEFAGWTNYTPTVVADVTLRATFNRFSRINTNCVDLTDTNYFSVLIKTADVESELSILFDNVELYIPSETVSELRRGQTFEITYSRQRTQELTNAFAFTIDLKVDDKNVTSLNNPIQIKFKNINNLNSGTQILLKSGRSSATLNGTFGDTTVLITTNKLGRFIIGTPTSPIWKDVLIILGFVFAVILGLAVLIIIVRKRRLARYKA